MALAQQGEKESSMSIYLSSDYGVSWSLSSASEGRWSCIAISSSGQDVVGAQGGDIYHSSNYGASWVIDSAVAGSWQSIACSSSGQYLVGLTETSFLYSSNYGASLDCGLRCIIRWRESFHCLFHWAILRGWFGRRRRFLPRPLLQLWRLLGYKFRFKSPLGKCRRLFLRAIPRGCSIRQYHLPLLQLWHLLGYKLRANRLLVGRRLIFFGQYLVAVQAIGGYIYLSSNYGSTWTQSSAPADNWYSVAMSSDGTQISAVQDEGGIWIGSST